MIKSIFQLPFFSLLASSFIILTSISCSKKTNIDVATAEGILLVGNTSEPKSLDGQVATGVIESKVITALFEGLCTGHPSEDTTAMPGAAESWTHSEDFKTWTFKLRKDGKWSDGTPLTTEDFLFSYERVLSPDFAAKYASMLYFLKGAEAFNKGETTDFATVGVKALDKYTLELKLKAPTPFLPEITKHYTWYPVPKHAVLRKGTMTEQHTLWTDPDNIVSNGPFKMKLWKFNYIIEVEKNENYWDAENVKLNGIKFFPVENAYTENRMFSNGQLHTTATVPSEMIEKARKEDPKSLKQETYLSTSFLRCNLTRKPLDNIKVRKAISLAIQRDDIIEFLLKGGQTFATSLTPPFGGYTPPKIIKTDLAEAKKLLAEAGYPNGKGFPEIDILTTSRETSVKLAEAIANMLKRDLGIYVNIKKYEWQTYLAKVSGLEYDLATGGWTGDYIDPTTFLDMWKKGDGNNRTGWSSEEYEKILETASQTQDPEKRLTLLAEAETLLLNERPIIPLYWNTSNYLLHTDVKGWEPLLLNNHPYKFIELKR